VLCGGVAAGVGVKVGGDQRTDLRLQFEAASCLDPDERNTLRDLIDGLLLKHEAKRWAA